MPLVNPPKKHHFVPECYLKNFVQGDDLYAINIQLARDGYGPRPRKVTPAQICYKDYYYVVKPEPANPMYALHDLSKFQIETDILRTWEDGYPALWERIVGKRRTTRNDAVAMAEFIIQMKIRNPAWERFNRQKGDRLYEEAEANLLKELAADPAFAHFPDPLVQMLLAELKQKFLADEDRAKQMQLSSLVHRAKRDTKQNEAFKKILVDASWNIIDLSQQSAYFVTTDNPGVAMDANNDVHNSKFTGGAFFFFPLSSKHCLVISDVERDNTYSSNSPNKAIGELIYSDEEVAGINTLLCRVCDTTVVSGSDIALIKVMNGVGAKQ